MAFAPESTLKSAIKVVSSRARQARRRKRKTGEAKNWQMPVTKAPTLFGKR